MVAPLGPPTSLCDRGALAAQEERRLASSAATGLLAEYRLCSSAGSDERSYSSGADSVHVFSSQGPEKMARWSPRYFRSRSSNVPAPRPSAYMLRERSCSECRLL